MRRFVTAAVTAPLAGFLLISTGCGFASLALKHVSGSGKVVEETRTVSSFSKIESAGSTDVVVTIGSPQRVVIKADDNILPLITTTVSDNALSIGSRGNYSTRNAVQVLVTMPSLTSLELAGSGAANINGLQEQGFEASLSGSGDITATGTTTSLKVSIAGSGDVHLFGLIAQHGEVSVTGSGNVEVHVSESLQASVMGSGDIVYDGAPEKLERRVIGSGEITARK
ncbi:MAG: head GIN domain-containing protein [Acidobacteriota bacterium]